MKIPKGIDDRPEQLRPPIYKGKGVTESERYLAHLAEKSFLNLWSYPSPFRDQRKGTKGDGKELCDLLVVCGRHIIIFSEKSIYWPGGDVKVAWCRWARRAIQHAVEQANGAERWLTNFPERVFLDRQCTVPFPIELPSSSDRLIHKVIVTRGAAEPCKTHLGYGNGSLIIEPSIVGDDHWPADPNLAIPFKVGYIDKKGPFVHVLNENSLAIITEELDTILDFATYLQKKEEFIRSKRLSIAHGEENLLAYYAARMNQNGEHDFVIPSGNASVNIQHHEYVKFKQDMRYKRKKEADKVSYLWDALIETFTSRMLDGTTIIIDDHDFEGELSTA